MELPQDNTRVVNLFQSIAESDNEVLAPIAFAAIIRSESGEIGERWQDALWSDYAAKLLESAVNKDLYKLSLFGYFELLQLTEQYPNSLFTKGCKEYASPIEGSYFGAGSYSNLRQPFIPERELKIWPKFLEKYPNHPAADDATYRIARAYEYKGDYENAIIWYHKSYLAPDGNVSRTYANARILLIIDFLMSSESLGAFLEKYPDHPLSPQILYSRVVALLRENKLNFAKSELQSFINKYRYSYVPSLVYGEAYLGLDFWNNIQGQLELIDKLIKIRNRSMSDKRLYEEGAFWFENHLAAYNFLWEGRIRVGRAGAVPEKWDGKDTSIKLVVTSDLVKKASSTYQEQLGWLKSAQTFQQLLEDYPNSKLAAKAKYSIGLSYYTLANGAVPTPTFDELGTSWTARTVKHFDEFVKDFPNSSMTDDALLSIADIMSSSGDNDYSFKETPVQVLQRLLKDYPRSDRAKEAREILKSIEASQ